MREELEHVIRHGLGVFLHECEGTPPALVRVTVEYESRHRHDVIHCVFSPDQHFLITIGDRGERVVGRRADHACALTSQLYSRLFEDHMVNLEVQGMRRVLVEATRNNVSPEMLFELQRSIRDRERHIREHHRCDVQAFVQHGHRTVDYRQMMVEVTGITPQALGVPDRAPSATVLRLRAEHVRHMDRMIEEVMYHGGRIEVGDPAAQAKGLALLKENLTPVQLEQYEKRQHFEVIGCDTRKLYRIRHGRQMNIEELDKRHRRVCGWCFLPTGALVVGDVLLAQKIALETNETAALKVANRFG